MNTKSRSRELPEKLLEQQAKKRKLTANTVQKAIDELKAEGCKVTMSNLVERTGFARATLSKPHVEEVLKNNRVCKYERIRVKKDNLKKDRADFELEIEELKKKLNDISIENMEMKNKMNALKVENYEQKDRIAQLLGELQNLNQKARMHGVRLEVIKN